MKSNKSKIKCSYASSGLPGAVCCSACVHEYVHEHFDCVYKHFAGKKPSIHSLLHTRRAILFEVFFEYIAITRAGSSQKLTGRVKIGY